MEEKNNNLRKLSILAHAASITTSLTFKTKKIFRSLLLLKIRLVFAALTIIARRSSNRTNCERLFVCAYDGERERIRSVFSLDSIFQCENLLLTPCKYVHGVFLGILSLFSEFVRFESKWIYVLGFFRVSVCVRACV